jgi:SAM-dependent methyltransferase
MEISKDVFKQVVNTVSEFKKQKQYELEIKYNGKVNRDAFGNTLQYYRSSGLKEIDHEEVLDIIFMYNGYSYRITINGKDNIQQYCLTNKILPEMVKEAISKRFISNFRPIIIDDFSFKIDMKEEIIVNDVIINELLVYVENCMKGFRYKKRFSYITKNGVFRHDFTIVKKSNSINEEFISNKRFSTSNILSGFEVYELEIEIVKRDKIEDVNTLALEFLKTGIKLYAVTNGIENIIPKKEKMDVIASYFNLTYDSNKNGRKPTISQVMMNPKKNFIGPQPITLELKNVVQDGLVVNTILEDYTVTEKADGERYLMYINKIGAVYFINNKLDVFSTGVTLNSITNTVFDGEYITKDASGKKLKLFAMFDVYFYNDKDVRSLPLISDDSNEDSRLSIMTAFYDKFKSKFTNTLIHVKKFYHGSNTTSTSIFDVSKSLINKINSNNFIYRIDGIIYTPKYLPVGGLYKSSKPDAFGTWTKVFKWKPPHENTIDMQVKENGKSSITVNDGKVMKVYNIYIGYQPSKWEPIKPKQFLESKIEQDTRYTLIQFSPPGNLNRDISMFYGDMDGYGTVKCKNGDDIYNNAIIEFSYINDSSLPYPKRWVPLRVRKDKTLPNDFSTAMNVWRSIENPVYEKNIIGDDIVLSRDLKDEDVYYKREISRDKFASKQMMDFHNLYIKKNALINTFKGASSLLDIACGKGGDLKKWIDADIKTVYGIDKVRDNIENPIDGIYARMMRHTLPDHKYIFGTMDASHIINESYVNSLKNEDDQFIGKKLLSHGKFDVISCQFAIHYFFENETIINKFVKNVSHFLKDGGHFIGTCLNGTKIKEKLQTINKQESITGKIDDMILWNIKKLYDDNSNDIKFGEQISIYMESIGIEMVEYLVSIPKLIEKLDEYGIVPVKIASFEDIYKETNEDIKLSQVEKEYSFLNTIFIFKKVGTETSPKTTPEPSPKPKLKPLPPSPKPKPTESNEPKESKDVKLKPKKKVIKKAT